MASGSMRNLISSLKTKASNHSFRGEPSASNIDDASSDEGQQQEDAPSLPMPDITRPFPVIEQPSRVILTSLGSTHFEKRRLTSTRRGSVQVTPNRGDREQFLLIPADTTEADDDDDNDATDLDNSLAATGSIGAENADPADPDTNVDEEIISRSSTRGKSKDMFYLKSYKFNRYLTSDSTGVVSTTDLSKKDANGKLIKGKPGESEKWLLMSSPHGGHFLVSAKSEENVACCHGKSITIGLKGDNDPSESWEVEFVSGELCFLSSGNNKQIRCDLVGKLSLTDDKRGWEVWRFIEMGGGKVRIVSWMHSQFCIICSHEGNISTMGIGKADEGCDEWTVEKAPEGFSGVVIKPVACASRILCHGEKGLSTTEELEGMSGIWQLDAAHKQSYMLTSFHHSRSIGPFPYVTGNAKQSDQLVLQQIDDEGTVRLYHKSLGQYIRSIAEGVVSGSSMPPDDSETAELWKMEQKPDGGYTFSSKGHNGFLAFEDDEVNPRLCTVAETTDDKREVWSVTPILPRAISSGKIKTFAIGTSVAVGTTVAMPFLMAGMLAVVPAQATVAASILSVGLTSAEAIASVGAIGATAAIVFRESSDTLGIESEHNDTEDEKDYTKRPFCAWRMW